MFLLLIISCKKEQDNSNVNVTDIDGNIYKTIVIGNQIWMAENLKVSKYRNGDPIITGLNKEGWMNTTSGAYAIYEDRPNYNQLYGKLYNWYAVDDQRGLCPEGWHIPTDLEWASLENFLGGVSIAGGKMKSIGYSWQVPNTGATNSSGFSGLPGGVRGNYARYYGILDWGHWWSSTLDENGKPLPRSLGSKGENIYRNYSAKEVGFSVRCIKD